MLGARAGCVASPITHVFLRARRGFAASHLSHPQGEPGGRKPRGNGPSVRGPTHPTILTPGPESPRLSASRVNEGIAQASHMTALGTLRCAAMRLAAPRAKGLEPGFSPRDAIPARRSLYACIRPRRRCLTRGVQASRECSYPVPVSALGPLFRSFALTLRNGFPRLVPRPTEPSRP